MGHGIDYRDYQIAARDAVVREFQAGRASTLLCLPTGTGKTIVAGMVAEEAVRHGQRVLFVAHREVLIHQAFATFLRFGLNTAVEMGQQSALAYQATIGTPDVVVGSVQTLQADRLKRWSPETFQYIIIDECHHALADSYTMVLNWFENYSLLGITATPSRGDRRNLGARFATKAYEYSLRRAISDGWLAPIRVRQLPIAIDLRGIKLSGGDFSLGELADVIGPKVEMLCRAFVKEAGARPSVVFTPDVGSALAAADVINKLGVPARYVAGEGGKFGMSKAERRTNLDDFNRGEYQVVVCCELLVEGWDCPRVECVGNMRPTLLASRFSQMIGRGTRPCPATGKADCLVLDFDFEADDAARDLCSSISLFDDGSLDEEVYTAAREIARQRAMDVDPIQVIEEAEKRVRLRTKFGIRLTGKEAKYEAVEFDPIGTSKLLGINLNRNYDLDWRHNNPASDAQLNKLRQLGIKTPEGLSKWGASKIIGSIIKRREQGYATTAQVRTLLAHGVEPDSARAMSAARASEAIAEISALNASQSKQQVLF